MTNDALISPRLVRLDLQGFKSFASKTTFRFEPGITAVIGPNGSGKSNISDAIRWVLGEQSYGALRSKKTEDVIFAGGRGRPAAGMAEVSVTFDNNTGWLPIDFSEVTVTRRAYRSGENHYLINNRRVRLKDITQLTASLGQSHTVIGQGLVDTALSQRAEERRALFEHAADVTGLRMKAVEAERSLNEAQTNSERLRDLLNELEPRLKTLSRAARQATEWREVHSRLRSLQRLYFQRLLISTTAAVRDAERLALEEQDLLSTKEQAVEQCATELHAAKNAADMANSSLEQHEQHIQSLIEQIRQHEHERDLVIERLQALTRRQEDMADTRSGLDDQVRAAELELESVAQGIVQIEAEVACERQTISRMQQQSAATQRARQQLETARSEVTTIIVATQRQLTDLAKQQALNEQRRSAELAEQVRLTDEIKERAGRLDQLRAELETYQQMDARDTDQLSDIEQRMASLKHQLTDAEQSAQQSRMTVTEIERRLDQARTRLDVLQRLHETGSGLFTGVRAVVQAARETKLSGVRGTLAELVTLPAEYDTAIEVALGSHLQDIVVERWSDAEAAIAFLKRTNSGRVTFQPLDTVRSTRQRELSSDILALPGVRGVAASQIDVATELRPIVDSLLGRTLLVENLEITRTTISKLAPGWTVVTLGGEIARTAGSVTGGAAIREGGLLARERELRRLPVQIQQIEQERKKVLELFHLSEEKPRTLAAEIRAHEEQRTTVNTERKERQGQYKRLTIWLRDLTNEQNAAQKRTAELEASTEQISRKLEQTINDIAETEKILNDAHDKQQTLNAQLSSDVSATADAERELAEVRQRLAGLDERLRAERRRESSLRTQQRALAEELAHRIQRSETLTHELTDLVDQRDRLVQILAELAALRETAERSRVPIAATARTASVAVLERQRTLESAQTVFINAERSLGFRRLEVERTQAVLTTVQRRIVDELEIENLDDVLMTILADTDQKDDAALEGEIAKLKDRLRRIGYVGEDAVVEYERESERQAFLRSQLADVEGATTSIRTVLDDLRSQMKNRFDDTFARVSTVFAETFRVLFGGGTARLVMTDAENGDDGGIDIVAQPPGKRLQSLALLSGGERSLTAVALLFAILKVNPTPFCLLDEVDAALDEANIVRFRDQLQTLAAETQAIVITHNRGTVEIADTLYGISMGDDGVSQILSLRMEEVIANPSVA